MRINGERSPGEGAEEEQMKTVSLSLLPPQKLVVVGYALTLKKKKSFLQPTLEALARPYSTPYYLFNEKYKDYQKKHPELTVVDPPDAIQRVRNRQSMLQDVADLDLSACHGKVCVPKQMVFYKDPSLIPYEVASAGLKVPLVAKPLIVDGTAKSHELFLAHDEFSLSGLEPPLVFQEFVNHGGVLFKIHIIEEAIKVVRRFFLLNVSRCELGMFPFPRVSSTTASADDADLDHSVAELPPPPLLEKLARELRWRMGLRLFNIDMIREHGTKDVFYVIDINYFPG